MPIQHHLHRFESIPELKPAFVEQYKELLGERYDDFIKYSTSYPHRAIRVNTLKTSVQEVVKRLEEKWLLEPVPWCKEAFWIESKAEEKRRDFGNITEHALGYFYVQEPASMVPPVVLDPQPGDVVLDMCAAPGSKSTQLAQYMQNEGLLVANEFTGSRIAPLAMNLQRLGAANAVCTHMDGSHISGVAFDKILVDAPCSGVGTISKSVRTVNMWNPSMIGRLAKTQLRLLERAYKLLKPGGVIVYSTCTTEPEENEGVVSSFLDKYGDVELEDIDLDIVRSDAIVSFHGRTYHKDVVKCLRIWPQDNDTEGFFIAKLRKKE